MNEIKGPVNQFITKSREDCVDAARLIAIEAGVELTQREAQLLRFGFAYGMDCNRRASELLKQVFSDNSPRVL